MPNKYTNAKKYADVYIVMNRMSESGWETPTEGFRI